MGRSPGHVCFTLHIYRNNLFALCPKNALNNQKTKYTSQPAE